jgi:hypothetical protein
MPRDNFSKAVQDILRRRVANRCSNPDCRVQTTGPATKSDKITNIGVAAHITAASPKGPRFSARLSKIDRMSLENGIWLCSNCATKIDRDTGMFTVAKIESWKHAAENTARQELGTKLPGASDAINTLTAALGGSMKKMLPNAIANVHTAAASALESLDPRFKIGSTFKDGEAHFQLNALCDVEGKINIAPEFVDEYLIKHRKLFDTGEDLEIDVKAVSFEGSKLLEEIASFTTNGTLKVMSQKRRAVQKIGLRSPDGTATDQFEDITGYLVNGTQSYRFDGAACDEILTFQYSRMYGSNEPVPLNFGVDRGKWIGQDINKLAYVKKIGSFFEKLASGWIISLSLEVGGEVVESGDAHTVDGSQFVLEQYRFFDFLNAVRTVAQAVKTPLVFTLGKVTAQQASAVHEAADIFEGRRIFQSEDIRWPIRIELIADPELKNVALLRETIMPCDIEIESNVGDDLLIMSKIIRLPNQKMWFHSVVPKIITDEINIIANGPVQIELLPADDFFGKIHYGNF